MITHENWSVLHSSDPICVHWDIFVVVVVGGWFVTCPWAVMQIIYSKDWEYSAATNIRGALMNFTDKRGIYWVIRFWSLNKYYIHLCTQDAD
jgi:hypothetical protein